MAFSLKAVFGIDATGVKTEIKQLRKELNTFVRDYAKLGAGLAIGAFVALSKGAIDLGSKLSDLSAQLGINVEKLQVLNNVARDAGVQQETVSKALVKTRTAAQEAADGNKTYADAFDALGINTAAFLALPVEQRLVAVGKAYEASANKNAAYNAIATIFGEKVGPKMMEVLGVLSSKSFPELTKAAKDAGQVMSAETIEALDKAGDAIDAFKQRITIAVGNIIVNFRTKEGIELMGLQLLKVAGQFGARIIDAIWEANTLTYAAFKGTFTGLAKHFKNAMVDVLGGIAAMINTVLPSSFSVDLTKILKLKEAGVSVAAEIAKAIAETEPLGFAKTVGDVWDAKIKAMEALIKSMQPPTKPDPKRPEDSPGEPEPPKPAKSPAESMEDAAKKFNDATENFANTTNSTFNKFASGMRDVTSVMLNAINGATLANVDDDTLKEIIRRNRQKIIDEGNAALNPNAGNFASRMATAGFETELGNAQRELDLRNRFRGDLSRLGEQRARQNYDPLIFEKLLSQLGPEANDLQAQSLNELKKLNERLNKGIQTRNIRTPSDLNE